VLVAVVGGYAPAVSSRQPSSIRLPVAGLLTADVISTAGAEMTAVALPWFVLVTTGSPARMGVVLAAEFVGLTMLGLVGARVASVVGPWRLMLGSDLCRAVLVAAIPLLSWLGLLSFPVILAIGFLVGGFFPAYQSSSQIIQANLVNDDEVTLTRLGGLLGAVNESASFVGPALGGVLVAVFGPSPVLLLDAASYLCAFALIGVLVRPAGSAAAAIADDDASIGAGLRYLWRNHDVRRLVLGVSVISLSWAALVATVPVLALHRGGASVAGLLLGAYGAGSVIGGLISSRARRSGGRTAVMSLFGLAAASWALLLASPTWTWGLAIGATGVASGLFYPRFFAALTSTTPPALRARVLSSVHIVISAPSAIGFVGAGLLAQQSTVTSRLLIAGSATLGAIMVAASPAALVSPTIVLGADGAALPGQPART
jgi:MFS family permease